MQIVIEIDDKEWMDEKSIREVAFEYEQGCAFDRVIREGLKQAIVLPKNHGRLIDADALKAELEEHRNLFVKAWGCFKDMPFSDKSRVDEIDNCISEILNAPTIIEGSEADDE